MTFTHEPTLPVAQGHLAASLSHSTSPPNLERTSAATCQVRYRLLLKKAAPLPLPAPPQQQRAPQAPQVGSRRAMSSFERRQRASTSYRWIHAWWPGCEGFGGVVERLGLEGGYG